MSLLTSPRLALAAALIGAGLLAAPVAHAFTIEHERANGQDQSFLYPDSGTIAGSGQTQQGFTSKDGMTTYKDGNTTLQFGHRRSFSQDYNTDHLFDPLGHPPGD
jgi:hypothetical protein